MGGHEMAPQTPTRSPRPGKAVARLDDWRDFPALMRLVPAVYPLLVRAGADLPVEILQLVGGEVLRLAEADDLAFVGFDGGDGVRELGGALGRDGDDAVLV